MMSPVPLSFWKYHGLGNDFIVVEGPPLMDPARAFLLCDRRRGIGADGVLSILPPENGGAAYMHIYNSDGSVASMCGNGIRCVARHLAETRGLTGEVLVETDAGPRRCRIHCDSKGAVESVSVDMGTARIEGDQEFTVGGERLRAVRVSMGNPHAVLFDEPSEARARVIGPAIEKMVPGGVNVGFARLRPGGLDYQGAPTGSGSAAPQALDLVVWERGAGLTDACGTGACAAAVAALRTGRVEAEGPIEVRLPGGMLLITVTADLRVEMRGPAERVFEGRTSL